MVSDTIVMSERPVARVLAYVRVPATNYSHQADGSRRLHAVAWSAELCDECLSVASAVNRVAAGPQVRAQWMHVHGIGLVPRKPCLDNYDRSFDQRSPSE
jgi:hypothetical protein